MARSSTIRVVQGQELPASAFTWFDDDDNVLPFAANWTFRLFVFVVFKVPVLDKSSFISGADVSPNITIAWQPGELSIPFGRYTYQLEARNISSQDRKTQGDFLVAPSAQPIT